MHEAGSPKSSEGSGAISRVQVFRGIEVLLPVDAPQNTLQVGDIQHEVRRSAIARAVEIYPGGVSAGARRTLDGQEQRLDIRNVNRTVRRSETRQRGQIRSPHLPHRRFVSTPGSRGQYVREGFVMSRNVAVPAHQASG